MMACINLPGLVLVQIAAGDMEKNSGKHEYGAKVLNTVSCHSPTVTDMLTEITDIVGCEVYTPNAVYVGNVKDVVLDLQEKRIDGIFIDRPNPTLVEGSVSISIPFRWVSSAGDIVVLRYFPGYIRTGAKKTHDEEEEGISDTLDV